MVSCTCGTRGHLKDAGPYLVEGPLVLFSGEKGLWSLWFQWHQHPASYTIITAWILKNWARSHVSFSSLTLGPQHCWLHCDCEVWGLIHWAAPERQMNWKENSGWGRQQFSNCLNWKPSWKFFNATSPLEKLLDQKNLFSHILPNELNLEIGSYTLVLSLNEPFLHLWLPCGWQVDGPSSTSFRDNHQGWQRGSQVLKWRTWYDKTPVWYALV